MEEFGRSRRILRGGIFLRGVELAARALTVLFKGRSVGVRCSGGGVGEEPVVLENFEWSLTTCGVSV